MERSFQKQLEPAPAVGCDTRTRVLNAAAELFATRGFAGTSISAIRAASGVLPSSIYWEFGSKHGILVAVLEDSAERWLNETGEMARDAWARARSTGRSPLEAYIENLAKVMNDRPEFLRLLLLLALERREGDPSTIQAIRRVRERAANGLARAFRAGGVVGPETGDETVGELARIALAFADGAFIAAQIDPGATDLRRMFSIFCAGMSAALRDEGAGITAGRGKRE